MSGKLLVIGGNVHGFAAPAAAYQHSLHAGIGTTKVLLPDALRKTIGTFLDNTEFAPSTPSGSFSKLALAEFLDAAAWADGTLLAGELGRNSETAITLESFIAKTTSQLTITRDAVDYFTPAPAGVMKRPNTLLVLSLAQLQKLTINFHFPMAITFGMDMLHLVDALHRLTTDQPANIIVKHLDIIFVASAGQVSTTKIEDKDKQAKQIWRLETAAHAAVWWLQNPNKPFQAMTTSILGQ